MKKDTKVLLIVVLVLLVIAVTFFLFSFFNESTQEISNEETNVPQASESEIANKIESVINAELSEVYLPLLISKS